MNISVSNHTPFYQVKTDIHNNPGNGLSKAKVRTETDSASANTRTEKTEVVAGFETGVYETHENLPYLKNPQIDLSLKLELLGNYKPYDRDALEAKYQNGHFDPYTKVGFLDGFHRNYLSEEEYKNFQELKERAGKDVSTLLRASYWAVCNGEDVAETLTGFMDFASGLSDEEFGNYLTAHKMHRDQGDAITEIAWALQGSDRTLYLEQAARGDLAAEALTAQASQLLEAGRSPGDVGLFLSAARKSGYRMGAFLNATSAMTADQKISVGASVVNDLSNRDIDAFLDIAAFASPEALMDIAHRVYGMASGDLSNFLTAASHSGDELGRFLSVLDDMAENNDPAYSDFLEAAAKSENEIGTLLDLKDEIDFEFAAGLSTVDTVNFLKAAKVEDADIDELSRVAGTLSGTEKSLFLYGAGNVVDDVDAFTAQTDRLAGRDRANFLLGTANRGEKTASSLVYMRGILSDAAYGNFMESADGMEPSELKQLMETVTDTAAGDRELFLQTAVDSGLPAEEFISDFNSLSYDIQKQVMDVGNHLDGETRKTYMQLALMPEERGAEFIDSAALLDDESQSGDLARFIGAAGRAEAEGGLDKFLAFTERLTREQKESFLSAASKDEFSLSGLIGLGEKNLEFAESGRHVEVKFGVKFEDMFNEITERGDQAFKDFSQTAGLGHRFYISGVAGHKFTNEITWRPKSSSYEIKVIAHSYTPPPGKDDSMRTDIVI